MITAQDQHKTPGYIWNMWGIQYGSWMINQSISLHHHGAGNTHLWASIMTASASKHLWTFWIHKLNKVNGHSTEDWTLTPQPECVCVVWDTTYYRTTFTQTSERLRRSALCAPPCPSAKNEQCDLRLPWRCLRESRRSGSECTTCRWKSSQSCSVMQWHRHRSRLSCPPPRRPSALTGVYV